MQYNGERIKIKSLKKLFTILLDELKNSLRIGSVSAAAKKAVDSSPAAENEIEISPNDAIVDRRQIRLLP